jgi:hypothetical protein
MRAAGNLGRFTAVDDDWPVEHRGDEEGVDGAHRPHLDPVFGASTVSGRRSGERVRRAHPAGGVQCEEIPGGELAEHVIAALPAPLGNSLELAGGGEAAGVGEGAEHGLLDRPQPTGDGRGPSLRGAGNQAR